MGTAKMAHGSRNTVCAKTKAVIRPSGTPVPLPNTKVTATGRLLSGQADRTGGRQCCRPCCHPLRETQSWAQPQTELSHRPHQGQGQRHAPKVVR